MGFIANSRSHLSTSTGRKSLGVCLSLSFVLITIIVVSSVWSTQWKSRVEDDLPSVLSDLGNTSPTPSPTSKLPETDTVLTPVIDTSIGCNGLASLCGIRVDEALFATVHNAGAIRGVSNGFPNHDRNLLEALEYGYRGINIDIGLCDDGFRMVHGSCLLGTASLVEGLQNITNFLQQNPNQVILMPTQLNFDSGGGSFTMQDLADFIQLNVPSFLDLLYQHDGTDTWPTLQQLIDSGKRILVFHYNGESCRTTNACPVGLQHDWFSYAGESAFVFDSADVILTNEACTITRGDVASSFYGVNMFPRVPSAQVCDIVNNEVRSHISRCTTAVSRPVTAVLVDCWDRGTVLQDVQAINEAIGNGGLQ